MLGTNPITISIPSDDIHTYICVDMATSITARGTLLQAKRKNEQIPEGLALDKDGKPTTDPAEGLEGSILPFGGLVVLKYRRRKSMPMLMYPVSVGFHVD